MTQPTPQPEIVNAPAPVDYFGFAEERRYTFPDGQQYITFSVMNEGAKARFQKMTQRDLVLERQSGNARMKMDPGAERHELILASVTDWHLFRQGIPVPFSTRALKDFLDLANPKLVEDLEKEIRKANPWLMAEMTVEDIDREIENLQEMRAAAVERERGEAFSSSK